MGKIAKGFAFGALTVGIAAVAAAAYYKSLSPEEQEELQDKFLDGIEAGKEKAYEIKELAADQFAVIADKLNSFDMGIDEDSDHDLKEQMSGIKAKYAQLSAKAKDLYADGKEYALAKKDAVITGDTQEKIDQIKDHYADLKSQADDLFLNAKDIVAEKSTNLKDLASEKFGDAQEEFDIVLDSQAAEVEEALTATLDSASNSDSDQEA
ncbi:MAG: hypothetical protein LBT37_08020 [Lactobacillaceae bacterium]|jgi:hypothetical protein|nr:hypothetical protein [Lactobacillaceae bacterium]